MSERFNVELALLQTMYPDSLEWNDKKQELSYTNDLNRCTFSIRIPEQYPEQSYPQVIEARICKHDIRDDLQMLIKQCGADVEVLDIVLEHVQELGEKSRLQDESKVANAIEAEAEMQSTSTVVVWLHHLLNTNKRKQALSPAASVSGVTKPGYPGVLIFSGPKDAVIEHVRELRSLNWQAFQVRFEEDIEWSFQHGTGMIEVESMVDVVEEVGSDHKKMLLDALRIT